MHTRKLNLSLSLVLFLSLSFLCLSEVSYDVNKHKQTQITRSPQTFSFSLLLIFTRSFLWCKHQITRSQHNFKRDSWKLDGGGWRAQCTHWNSAISKMTVPYRYNISIIVRMCSYDIMMCMMCSYDMNIIVILILVITRNLGHYIPDFFRFFSMNDVFSKIEKACRNPLKRCLTMCSYDINIIIMISEIK